MNVEEMVKRFLNKKKYKLVQTWPMWVIRDMSDETVYYSFNKKDAEKQLDIINANRLDGYITGLKEAIDQFNGRGLLDELSQN